MTDLLVSVVIPARDAGRYLGEAIASVLAQELRPLEVIVVDDGSTDDTAEVAAGFAGVRVERSGGVGAAGARNVGIAAASGAYLAFLDADDLWTGGKLAGQLAALRATPAASMAFGWVRQFVSPDVSAEVRATLICPPGAAPFKACGTLLAPRALVEEVGPFDEGLRAGEFVDWYSRARLAGAEEVVPEQVVLLRRLHGGNMGFRRPDLRRELARAVAGHLRRSDRRLRNGG